MSFFSTSDIITSLVSGDLIKSIINNPGFKQGLDKIDIKEYFLDEVIEDITNEFFQIKRLKNSCEK